MLWPVSNQLFFFISKISLYYINKISTSGTDVYTLFRYYVKIYGVLIQVVLLELSIHRSVVM